MNGGRHKKRCLCLIGDIWGVSKFTGCQIWPCCQMACMVDFAVLFLGSFLIFTHVFFCCLYTSVHNQRFVTPVLFCYFSCFTPHCTSSGPSADFIKSIMDVIWQSFQFDRQLNWIWKWWKCEPILGQKNPVLYKRQESTFCFQPFPAHYMMSYFKIRHRSRYEVYICTWDIFV